MRKNWLARTLSNVPVPEPHVVGLVVGVVLHRLCPAPIVNTQSGDQHGDWKPARTLGKGLIAFGLGLIVWAIHEVGRQDVEAPRTLVTTGPFGVTRNPMYVGWSFLYLGSAVLLNSLWLLLELPFVLFVTHKIVRSEEDSLERTFGTAFRTYRRKVPRYI